MTTYYQAARTLNNTIKQVKHEARLKGEKPSKSDPRIWTVISELCRAIEDHENSTAFVQQGRPSKYSFTRDDLINIYREDPQTRAEDALRKLAGDDYDEAHPLTWDTVARRTEGLRHRTARQIAVNLRRYGQETEPDDVTLTHPQLKIEKVLLTHPRGIKASAEDVAMQFGVSSMTVYNWGLAKIRKRLEHAIVSPENLHLAQAQLENEENTG